MIIQFSGLSGAGKTTLANHVKTLLSAKGIAVEIVDGDVYRLTICRDLGFSREDREENIRRLARVAAEFSSQGSVAIISAINPYQAIRDEVTLKYPGTKTIFIRCNLAVLIERDPKGLYRKSMLPDDHPEKIHNLTGISDPYEIPVTPDLIIDTTTSDIDLCTAHLADYITGIYKSSNQ